MPFQSACLGASGRIGSLIENDSRSISFRISSSSWFTAKATGLPAGSSPGMGAISASTLRSGGEGMAVRENGSTPEEGIAGDYPLASFIAVESYHRTLFGLNRQETRKGHPSATSVFLPCLELGFTCPIVTGTGKKQGEAAYHA